MRYRERNVLQQSETFQRQLINCNGTLGGTQSHSAIVAKSFEKMWDDLTPSFHKKLRDGEILPVHDLVHEKLSYTLSPGTSNYYKVSCGPGNGGGVGPAAFQPITDFEHIPPDVYTWAGDNAPQLAKEAIARAKSPDFDFLTFVAELNKTVRLFGEAAQRFDEASWRLAKAAKHRSRKSGREALDVFSQLWLEGRYGWRIAYLDAISILEAIEKSGSLRSRGYAEAESESTVPTSRYYAVSSNGLGLEEYGMLTSKVKLRVGTMYSIRIDGPNLGLSPFTTAWELLPYSFVIDWFIDVGTTLNALSVRPSFKREFLWMTTEVDTSWASTGHSLIDTDSQFAWTSASPSSVTHSFWRKTRGPVPSINYFPAFDWDFSLIKLVDLIALLITSKTKLIGYLLR